MSLRRHWKGLLAAPALWALIASSGCQPDEPSLPPNFVFVLIDTLRLDRMSAYGHSRDTTPFIDELASRGLRFHRSIAQAPWTGASMASLWTSRLPSEVGGTVLANQEGVHFLARTGVTPLKPDVTTLAEGLSQAGYETLAVVANPYAGPQFKLLRAFNQQRRKRVDAAEVVTTGIGLLESGNASEASPFFLYLHFLDPHEPTFPPLPYRQRYRALDGRPHKRIHAEWPDPGVVLSAGEVKHFRSHRLALYDGAIRYVDDQLRRLSEHLHQTGRLENTIFVIASDHGEAFWDHQEFEGRVHIDPRGAEGTGHGQSLFGEVLDVPLILSGPGVPQAVVVEPVRNLDIAPTILALAGVDPADFDPRGVDLLRARQADELGGLVAASENIAYGVEARSVEEAGFKFVRYSKTRIGETRFLYDRSTDPKEEHDLREAKPEIAARMERRLDQIFANLGETQARPVELPQAVKDELQAIGYVE